ncbi:MAG: Metallo-beta-lactamase superfamily protein [Ilumatobacteraceae bacterium]|nr:Metallo-beta-lactamase superfamily protein [Ilumatobacteraceae bacterium]
MARMSDRHPGGAPGPWFVDSRCIDCDAARHVAPGLIARNPSDGVSLFLRQPQTPEELEMAWRAVEVCPTRSVGHETLRRPESPVFPQDLGDGVFRLGHNAESSFGAHSYLVRRLDDGRPVNLMIDSPRWTREVYEPVQALGGIQHVLLTHRDDVADADRYAQHFGAAVWIHADDRGAAPFADRLIEGVLPAEIVPGVVAFPVPGHTKGSVLYHVDGHVLFSGDSLAWDAQDACLVAFRDACWYSWSAQQESLDRFAAGMLRFDRLLCGHGWSHDLDAETFHRHLLDLVDRMG